MVKTDGVEVSGFGQIATMIVVLDDDLAKQSIPFELTWGSVDLIRYDESLIEVSPQNAQTEIEIPTTSAADLLAENLAVFPNPAQDRVTVRMDQIEGEYEVRLLDLTGRVHQQVRLTSTTREQVLQVESLAAGMYVLQFKTAGLTVFSKKLMIE
ncbi:MAG: T9SS type A sorting domain-containing protein [Bacteroidota bacterium]